MKTSKTFSIQDIFSLLTTSVDLLTGKQLVNICEEYQMLKQEFIDHGHDDSLPAFDKGHLYIYTTDNNEISTFEILERNNEILQAGFQISYKSSFFNTKIKKDFRIAKQILDEYYGIGIPMTADNVELYNYGDTNTICYVSKMRINRKYALTLRVGNVSLWND